MDCGMLTHLCPCCAPTTQIESLKTYKNPAPRII